MTILKRIFIPMLCILVCCCGGGGGGNSHTDSEPDTNIEQEPPPPLITRENAVYIMSSVFYFTKMTRDIVYNVPYVAYSYYYHLGSGDYSDEASCDNPEGTISFDTSFSPDGTGEVLFIETECENSLIAAQSNGVFRITVNETDENFFPVDYEASYEEYEIVSTTGPGGTVIDGTIYVQPGIDSQQAAYVDMKAMDATDRSRYLETGDMTFDLDTPSGGYPLVADARVSGTVKNTDFGTVAFFTAPTMAVQMVISDAEGTEGGLWVKFVDEYYISACLDVDGDTVHEAFLHASIFDLGGDYGENDAPVVDIQDTLETQQDTSAVISLLDVTDPDCDFLDYALEIISSPEGSRVDWHINHSDTLYIDADLPGDYLLELTVSDGHGGMTGRQISLHISPNPDKIILGRTSPLRRRISSGIV